MFQDEVFLLWLQPFILSGVISPLISSSIFGIYRPGEFLFQCPIILPSHTVHGVLKARTLKWFAIPFSSAPRSVRPLHHDPTVLGGPTRHGLVSLSQTRLWSWDQTGQFSVIMVSVRLPSGNIYRLTWAWGISSWLFQQSTAAAPYLGRGVSSHGHHELLIAKFRLKSKKVGKTTRPLRI